MRFLHSIAQELLATSGQIHHKAIIFPNRRAGVHFRQSLSEMLEKPLLSPAVLTLSDFIFQCSGRQPIEPVALLYLLYGEYQALFPESEEDFGSFSAWGDSLLRDFAEVDNYLLDADQVFSYLNQEKAIEMWRPDRSELSEYEQNYLNFYRQLGALYHRLHHVLAEKGQAYPALATRLVCEQFRKQITDLPYEEIWFCGFNALNAAELGIFKALRQAKIAHIHWDSDQYYLEDEQHEAGLFLRQWMQDPLLRDGHQSGDCFSQAKNISVIQAAGQLAQCKAASEQIRLWQQQDPDLSRSLLVLADESLLVPMLNSLPEGLPALNITMGYPTQLGQAHVLVQLLLRLLNNADQTNSYYFRDLLPLLQLPLLRTDIGETLRLEWIDTLQVRIPAGKLEPLFEEIPDLRPLLGHPMQAVDFPAAAIRLLSFLGKSKEVDTLQQQLSLQLISLLRRIELLFDQAPEMASWSMLKQLWQQLSARESLDFLGEPLSGLQLMGLLETRCLDFERVMVIGLNEGILPGKAGGHSFITSSLRMQFALPGPREKEAVYAYHFYRLLQDARQIVLSYNSVQDDLNGGEPSRYLLQLRYELARFPQHQWRELSVMAPFKAEKLQDFHIHITRHAALQQKVKDRLARGLSPTALAAYMACSLRFYFAHIIGLREAEELNEQLDARAIGNILHETLEELYKPYVGRLLTAGNIVQMEKELPQLFPVYLQKNLKNAQADQGLNLLVREIAYDYLERFLAQEKSWLQKINEQGKGVEIIALEKELVREIVVDGEIYRVKGKADRIDQVDGEIRITDYKTGTFKDIEIKFDDLNEPFSNAEKVKGVQLLLYAWMLAGELKSFQNIEAGIYSMRKLSAGLSTLKIGENTGLKSDEAEKLTEKIGLLLKEMLDEKTAFTQTTDLDTCKYCNFKSICLR
jgi:hypothetical protein